MRIVLEKHTSTVHIKLGEDLLLVIKSEAACRLGEALVDIAPCVYHPSRDFEPVTRTVEV